MSKNIEESILQINKQSSGAVSICQESESGQEIIKHVDHTINPSELAIWTDQRNSLSVSLNEN